MTGTPQSQQSERPWEIVLICCGRDAGTWPAETWEEADAIRNSYVAASDTTGHERAAIVRRAAAKTGDEARDA